MKILTRLFDRMVGKSSNKTRTPPRHQRKPSHSQMTLEQILKIPRLNGHRDDLPYLSLRQPWAWLVLNGHKDIENRGRVSHHRGELFIHASSNKSNLQSDIQFVWEEYGIKVPENELQFGALLGSVLMVDCVTTHESKWFSGKFGYVVRDPKLITPIKMKANAGMQRSGEIQVHYFDP